MPRRYRPEKRVAEPDPKFGDRKVQSFINRMMKDGKILVRMHELLSHSRKRSQDALARELT